MVQESNLSVHLSPGIRTGARQRGRTEQKQQLRWAGGWASRGHLGILQHTWSALAHEAGMRRNGAARLQARLRCRPSQGRAGCDRSRTPWCAGSWYSGRPARCRSRRSIGSIHSQGTGPHNCALEGAVRRRSRLPQAQAGRAGTPAQPWLRVEQCRAHRHPAWRTDVNADGSFTVCRARGVGCACSQPRPVAEQCAGVASLGHGMQRMSARRPPPPSTRARLQQPQLTLTLAMPCGVGLDANSSAPGTKYALSTI